MSAHCSHWPLNTFWILGHKAPTSGLRMLRSHGTSPRGCSKAQPISLERVTRPLGLLTLQDGCILQVQCLSTVIGQLQLINFRARKPVVGWLPLGISPVRRDPLGSWRVHVVHRIMHLRSVSGYSLRITHPSETIPTNLKRVPVRISSFLSSALPTLLCPQNSNRQMKLPVKSRDNQMAKDQHKNIINKSQSNMASAESSYPKAISPGYLNTIETQENDLKSTFMKMITEETNKICKEI